jgi:hypothetical protein
MTIAAERALTVTPITERNRAISRSAAISMLLCLSMARMMF